MLLRKCVDTIRAREIVDGGSADFSTRNGMQNWASQKAYGFERLRYFHFCCHVSDLQARLC